MPRRSRQTQMTLRLDDEEIMLRDMLARHHGIDSSGVLRQALRRWAREEGITAAPAPPAKKSPARQRSR